MEGVRSGKECVLIPPRLDSSQEAAEVIVETESALALPSLLSAGLQEFVSTAAGKLDNLRSAKSRKKSPMPLRWIFSIVCKWPRISFPTENEVAIR